MIYGNEFEKAHLDYIAKYQPDERDVKWVLNYVRTSLRHADPEVLEDFGIIEITTDPNDEIHIDFKK